MTPLKYYDILTAEPPPPAPSSGAPGPKSRVVAPISQRHIMRMCHTRMKVRTGPENNPKRGSHWDELCTTAMQSFYNSFVCILGHTWLGSIAAVPEELRTRCPNNSCVWRTWVYCLCVVVYGYEKLWQIICMGF